MTRNPLKNQNNPYDLIARDKQFILQNPIENLSITGTIATTLAKS